MLGHPVYVVFVSKPMLFHFVASGLLVKSLQRRNRRAYSSLNILTFDAYLLGVKYQDIVSVCEQGNGLQSEPKVLPHHLCMGGQVVLSYHDSGTHTKLVTTSQAVNGQEPTCLFHEQLRL
jgi:hypothetical protein